MQATTAPSYQRPVPQGTARPSTVLPSGKVPSSLRKASPIQGGYPSDQPPRSPLAVIESRELSGPVSGKRALWVRSRKAELGNFRVRVRLRSWAGFLAGLLPGQITSVRLSARAPQPCFFDTKSSKAAPSPRSPGVSCPEVGKASDLAN